jgi:hypothetical protein
MSITAIYKQRVIVVTNYGTGTEASFRYNLLEQAPAILDTVLQRATARPDVDQVSFSPSYLR